MLKQGILLFLCFLTLSGCAVVMSAERSYLKGDPNLLKKGTLEQDVLTSFGEPDQTEELRNHQKRVFYKIDTDKFTITPPDWTWIPKDHYKIKDHLKWTPVLGHALADFLTLGLWEIVGTPIEKEAQSKIMLAAVTYGSDARIIHVDMKPDQTIAETPYWSPFPNQ